MYCPNCGQSSPEDRKFCKYCGTNLSLVSQTLARGVIPPKSLSEATAKILEDWLGEDPQPLPEQKQLNDIRNGVITGCVGVGVSIFLYVLMNAIAASPSVDPAAVPILRSVWIAGLIPLMVGVGLLINGIFFYKPLKQSANPVVAQATSLVSPATRPALTQSGVQGPPSVTEQTTHRLETPIRRRSEKKREQHDS